MANHPVQWSVATDHVACAAIAENGSTEPRMRPLLRANRATVPKLLPLAVAAPVPNRSLGLAAARDSAATAPTLGTVARLRRSAPAKQWADGCRRLGKKDPRRRRGKQETLPTSKRPR